MARRKKLPMQTVPDYTNLGDLDKMIVQLSVPLQSLSYVLSLPELKILNVYLGRINSHKNDKRFVRLEKGVLEDTLGVTRLNKADLDERLKGLFTSVMITDPNKEMGYTRIGLFEKAVAEQDENGLWQVDLICTESAMEYIFNIEHLTYLSYALSCVVNLTSIYSYRMFVYLEKNRWRTPWTVKVDVLKKELGVGLKKKKNNDKDKETDTYKEFKYFRRDILEKCCKELNEKTSCHFKYETIKTGTKITAIKFYLETKKDLMPPKNENEIEGQIISEQDISWQSVLNEFDFSEAQIKALEALLETVPKDNMPEIEDKDERWQHYLKQKVAKMMAGVESTGDKLNSPYRYLIKLLEKDQQSRKSKKQDVNKSTNKWNVTGNEREIDFDEMEAMVFIHDND